MSPMQREYYPPTRFYQHCPCPPKAKVKWSVTSACEIYIFTEDTTEADSWVWCCGFKGRMMGTGFKNLVNHVLKIHPDDFQAILAYSSASPSNSIETTSSTPSFFRSQNTVEVYGWLTSCTCWSSPQIPTQVVWGLDHLERKSSRPSSTFFKITARCCPGCESATARKSDARPGESTSPPQHV